MNFNRYEKNPIIYPALSESIGDNINGASLIRVPEWIKNPLGKYYLYFAHHRGLFIRLAYADSIFGPWKIYEPGTLQLNEVTEGTGFNKHIGSPDVHIDNDKQEILMYFHSPILDTKIQKTGLALSKDGIKFKLASDEIFGPFYFRVFYWNGMWYSISKNNNVSGQILKSNDRKKPFIPVKDIIPNMRHAAVMIRGSTLYLFHTVVGHAPESILLSTIDLSKPCVAWEISKPIEVAKPEMDYEGIQYPIEPSRFGPTSSAQQLRDPCIFEEDGKIYLLYSVAGESGIAIAEFEL